MKLRGHRSHLNGLLPDAKGRARYKQQKTHNSVCLISTSVGRKVRRQIGESRVRLVALVALVWLVHILIVADVMLAKQMLEPHLRAWEDLLAHDTLVPWETGGLLRGFCGDW